jgi:hypothetical protein
MLRHAYDRITATRRSRHKRPTIHTSHTDQTAKLETSKTGELLHTNAFRSWRDFSHVVNARIRHVESAVDEAAVGATPLRLVIWEFVRYAEAGQRIRHGE